MISARMIQFWVKILALVVILLATTLSKAEQTIPSLTSHVTDLTATLSASEITQLEQKLAAFEKARGSQVALLIVPTTQPETIEQYALRVAETWKPGRKGIDDGILLLIAKNDRTLRIEVGYGVEGVLPDAMAKRIIAEIIVPQFKSGNFVAGIDAGIEAILGLIKGESLPLPPTHHSASNSTGMHTLLNNFIPILIGLIVLGRMLQAVLGRIVGAAVTSIGVGFIGWLFFSSIVIAILIAIVVFFMSLFQSAASGIYRNGRNSWPDNGFRSGGFGSGGSGGGFSGGGGGFGGGGASGRW